MITAVKWILFIIAVYAGVRFAGAWTLISTRDYVIISDRIVAKILRETQMVAITLSVCILIAAKVLGAF